VGLKKNTLNGVPLDLKIQGGFGDPRKSDTEWKDLLVSSGKNSTGWQVFYLNNRNPYRYYRLYITSTQDGSNIRLDEWVLYEGIDVEKRIVSQLRLRPLDKDAQEIYFPKEIYVYGSMDFDGWTLLGSFSTYTPLYDGPYGRWQRYDLGNTVGYWAYKLTFVGNWNSTADKVAIAEWEMVQKTDTIPTYSILYGDHEEINSIYADPDTTFDDGWVYTGSYMVTYVHDDKTVNYSYIGTLLMDINTL